MLHKELGSGLPSAFCLLRVAEGCLSLELTSLLKENPSRVACSTSSASVTAFGSGADSMPLKDLAQHCIS